MFQNQLHPQVLHANLGGDKDLIGRLWKAVFLPVPASLGRSLQQQIHAGKSEAAEQDCLAFEQLSVVDLCLNLADPDQRSAGRPIPDFHSTKLQCGRAGQANFIHVQGQLRSAGLKCLHQLLLQPPILLQPQYATACADDPDDRHHNQQHPAYD